MNDTSSPYPMLAELFHYPDADFADRVERAQAVLDGQYPDAACELQPFTAFAAQASVVTLEELFTRSFDVQAVTTLDIGYVLFGDDYKRGALLVNLNREHREAGNDCGSELADHLPNVLRLLPKMQDVDLRVELVEKLILPALQKIIRAFDPKKIERKKKVYLKHHKTWIERPDDYGTIYQQPLRALYVVLQTDFHAEASELPQPSADFLQHIGTEIALEGE